MKEVDVVFELKGINKGGKVEDLERTFSRALSFALYDNVEVSKYVGSIESEISGDIVTVRVEGVISKDIFKRQDTLLKDLKSAVILNCGSSIKCVEGSRKISIRKIEIEDTKKYLVLTGKIEEEIESKCRQKLDTIFSACVVSRINNPDGIESGLKPGCLKARIDDIEVVRDGEQITMKIKIRMSGSFEKALIKSIEKAIKFRMRCKVLEDNFRDWKVSIED